MLTTAETESGFTVIELLVVIVLLALLISVAGRAMVDSWHTGKRSSNTTSAIGKATIALDTMGRDVRATQSPARASSVANNDQLRGILLTDKPSQPLLEDVRFAGPTRLQLRADVVQDAVGSPATYECVDYHLDAKRNLVRTVYSDWDTCSGATLADEILVDALPSGEQSLSASNPLFTYTEVFNPLFAKAVLDPNDCKTIQNQPGPGSGYLTNRIYSVHVNLQSFVSPDASTSGRVELADDFDIITRNSHDYMFAMGCAF